MTSENKGKLIKVGNVYMTEETAKIEAGRERRMQEELERRRKQLAELEGKGPGNELFDAYKKVEELMAKSIKEDGENPFSKYPDNMAFEVEGIREVIEDALSLLLLGTSIEDLSQIFQFEYEKTKKNSDECHKKGIANESTDVWKGRLEAYRSIAYTLKYGISDDKLNWGNE